MIKRIPDNDDEFYCSNCFPQVNILDYTIKPSPLFKVDLKKEKIKRENLYFGVELEVENMENTISNNDMAERIIDYGVYCKSDSSISNGFEVVTHPFTWDWYKDEGKDICSGQK